MWKWRGIWGVDFIRKSRIHGRRGGVGEGDGGVEGVAKSMAGEEGMGK